MTEGDEFGSNIDGEEVAVMEAPKAKAPAKKKPPVGLPQTIKIILEENESIPPTGLFLSHNGKPYIIQTGVEVEIPLYLKEILDNAVTAVPVVDAATKQVLGYRERLRYSYRVIN